MNIKDVTNLERAIEDDADKLDLIFLRQRELMEKYHVIEAENGLLTTDKVPVDIDCAKGQARLKDFAWRVTEELGEAMNCLKNKPWKKTQMLTDIDHYLEELADAFHFFIELCILSGLNSESLFDLYFRKSEVNKWRQKTKY